MAIRKYSAGAIIYTENGKIEFLLLRNTLKNTYWEVPKGKIEKGEKIKSTIRREVEEETNIKNIKFIEGFKHKLSWYFRLKGETILKKATYLLAEVPRDVKDKVKITHEHEKYGWFSYQEAMKKIKIKGNKEMIEKAYKFIKKKQQD